MHMIRTACFALSLLLVPISEAGAAPQAPASTRMITRAGHRLAFHVTPGHRPIIVLDAGGGLDSIYWAALLPELAKRTGSEIITYDRSGFGRSDEVKGAWDVHAATEDLATGLRRLGATHQVILVSHSIAGEIATYLTGEHPDWFAGAVLVDANVPDFFTDETIAASAAAYAPAIAAAKAGPPTKESRQLLAVAASFDATARAFHKAAWPSTVPVVVIVSEKTPFDDAAAAQWWRDAHAQFAKGPGERRLVTAEHSSHDVAHDRADVIIQAIVDMAARAR